MKKNQRLISFITALAVMSGMLCGCTAESTEEVPAVPAETHEVLDVSAIRPQDDFYGYINAEHVLDTLPAYSEMTWRTL